MYIKILMLRK